MALRSIMQRPLDTPEFGTYAPGVIAYAGALFAELWGQRLTTCGVTINGAAEGYDTSPSVFMSAYNTATAPDITSILAARFSTTISGVTTTGAGQLVDTFRNPVFPAGWTNLLHMTDTGSTTGGTMTITYPGPVGATFMVMLRFVINRGAGTCSASTALNTQIVFRAGTPPVVVAAVTLPYVSATAGAPLTVTSTALVEFPVTPLSGTTFSTVIAAIAVPGAGVFGGGEMDVEYKVVGGLPPPDFV